MYNISHSALDKNLKKYGLIELKEYVREMEQARIKFILDSMSGPPEFNVNRVSMEQYAKYTTERGAGALGSSGK